jgi:hypothetical protein
MYYLDYWCPQMSFENTCLFLSCLHILLFNTLYSTMTNKKKMIFNFAYLPRIDMFIVYQSRLQNRNYVLKFIFLILIYHDQNASETMTLGIDGSFIPHRILIILYFSYRVFWNIKRFCVFPCSHFSWGLFLRYSKLHIFTNSDKN